VAFTLILCAACTSDGMVSYSPPAAKKAVLQDSAQPQGQWSTEEYDRVNENEFLSALQNPLSTFSIDVDTASYANSRRMLNDNYLPPNNFVFLLDVSDSMLASDKLPLVQGAMRLLVEQLRPIDRVAIVTYAGAAGLALESTSGEDKAKISKAIDSLSAGGSTAGGAGIQLAYSVAEEDFLKEGNNRIILATDGDFNVGVSSSGGLTRLIEEKQSQGIALSVLGVGSGNLKDSRSRFQR